MKIYFYEDRCDGITSVARPTRGQYCIGRTLSEYGHIYCHPTMNVLDVISVVRFLRPEFEFSESLDDEKTVLFPILDDRGCGLLDGGRVEIGVKKKKNWRTYAFI